MATFVRARAHVLASLAALAAIGISLATASCHLGRVAGSSVSCDHRKATTDPKPYCQEVIDTVADDEFLKDCSDHLKAAGADQPCTLQKVIGGCQLDDTFEDGSHVTDWYYSTSGDPNASKYPAADVPKSVADVKAFCADKKRYERPAHYVAP